MMRIYGGRRRGKSKHLAKSKKCFSVNGSSSRRETAPQEMTGSADRQAAPERTHAGARRGREVALPTRAQVLTERSKLRRSRAFRSAVVNTVAILLVVAALAVLTATLFLPVLQISGTSMEPTLYNGDIIVLIKTGSYGRGDLCSFAYENKYLIKRVIGVPGDYIEIDSGGDVYVNGELLDEPYVTEKALGECDMSFPYQVPDGHYFMMGDHRSTSIDSRSSVIGSVSGEQIVGRVLAKLWPLGKGADGQ